MQRPALAWRGPLAAMLACTTLLPATADAASVTVEVESDGASLYEAQQNGVRLALQQVVPQIVVVDRAIKDDEVVRDNLMSSMSGFVENIRILRQVSDAATGARVRMQVTVSTTEIENYVEALPGRQGVRVGALFAESDRELQSRMFRDVAMGRLFRGYPSQAVQVSLLSAGVDKNDPNLLRFAFEYRLDPRFIDSMVAGAKRLACPAQDVRHPSCSSTKVCWMEPHKPLLGRASERETCVVIGAGAVPKKEFGSRDAKAIASVEALDRGLKNLGVLLRFKRKDGTRIGSDCYDLVFGGEESLLQFRHESGVSPGLTIVSLRKTMQAQYTIPRSLVAGAYVKDAESIDALPALVDQVRLDPDKFFFAPQYAVQFDITSPLEATLSYYAEGGHQFRPAMTPKYASSVTRTNALLPKGISFSPSACRWPA